MVTGLMALKSLGPLCASRGARQGRSKARQILKSLIETVYCAVLLPQNALHVHYHWPYNGGYLQCHKVFSYGFTFKVFWLLLDLKIILM